MESETNIAQVVDITADKAKYDNSVKEILADKQILARILKYTLDEFKDMDIDSIIANIDNPVISGVRVEPGHTNTDRIKGDSEEDNVIGEGKLFFDIRFSAYTGVELLKILINIEAQRSTKSYKLGYHLDNRVIFYIARMISAQKEVEFKKSDYDNLKAVRSIWICMDAGNDEDSINRIRLKQETIFGKNMELNNLDKVQGVIIRLRNDENAETSKNQLIAMLEELLKKESAEVKKKRLSEEYGLKMSIETERRLSNMCNLSEVMLEKGIEQGITKGIEQGITKGIEQGKMQGMVIARYEDGMSIEQIAEKSNTSVDEVKEILRQNGIVF